MYVDSYGNIKYPKHEFCESIIVVKDIDETIVQCFKYEDRKTVLDFLGYINDDKLSSREYLGLIVDSALSGNEFSDFIEYLEENYNEVFEAMQLLLIANYWDNCLREIPFFNGIFNLVYCNRKADLKQIKKVLEEYGHWNPEVDLNAGGTIV